jgi:DNA-binding MarR family transcriptional regulator
MQSTVPHLELEAFLPYRLSVLTNTVSNAIARDYQQRFGLTIPEWRAMAVLGRFGPASAGEICDRTAMDKVTVSRANARLIARGLVKRATDRTDRRRAIVRLTRKGRSVHDRIVPVALDHERRMLAALNARECAQLDCILGKLQAGAGDETAA